MATAATGEEEEDGAQSSMRPKKIFPTATGRRIGLLPTSLHLFFAPIFERRWRWEGRRGEEQKN